MPDATALPQIAEKVIPRPATDAPAPDWARYHWTRARGWSLTVDDLVAHGDSGARTLAQITSLFIAEVRIAYLIDALIEADAEDHAYYPSAAVEALQRELESPETLDALINLRLRAYSVDPRRIARYQHAGDQPQELPAAAVRPLFREPPA